VFYPTNEVLKGLPVERVLLVREPVEQL
jgi:hypothetical protein